MAKNPKPIIDFGLSDLFEDEKKDQYGVITRKPTPLVEAGYQTPEKVKPPPQRFTDELSTADKLPYVEGTKGPNRQPKIFDYKQPEVKTAGFNELTTNDKLPYLEEPKSKQVDTDSILKNILTKKPPKITDTTVTSETTKQVTPGYKEQSKEPAGALLPGVVGATSTDFDVAVHNLGKLQKDIETRLSKLDKTDENSVNEFNKQIDNYKTEFDKFTKQFPANQHPDLNKGFYPEQNTSISEGPGVNELSNFNPLDLYKLANPLGRKELTDKYLGDRDTQGAAAYVKYITGKDQLPGNDNAINRIGGAITQGAASTISGTLGFAKYITDKAGITDPRQQSRAVQNIESWIKEIAPENPNFLEGLASAAGSMAIFVPFGKGITSLANGLARVSPKVAYSLGTSGMTVLEAMMEAGSVYTETNDPKAAEKSFLANLVLIGVTNRFGIRNPEQLGKIKAKLLSGGFEGFQELGQQIISDVSQGKKVDWKAGLESFAYGGILGVGFEGSAKDGSPNQTEQAPELVKPLETKQPKAPLDIAAEVLKPKETKPNVKQDNATQLEIMKKAGIPEEDIPNYALSSVADGKILRSYLNEVKAGDITVDEAAERVKKDYEKMKSGEKEAEFIEPETPKPTGNFTDVKKPNTPTKEKPIPFADWENNLIKARSYAIDLGIVDSEMKNVWTDAEAITQKIKEHLGETTTAKPTTKEKSQFTVGDNVVYKNYPGSAQIVKMGLNEVDLKLEGGQTVTVGYDKIVKPIAKVDKITSLPQPKIKKQPIAKWSDEEIASGIKELKAKFKGKKVRAKSDVKRLRDLQAEQKERDKTKPIVVKNLVTGEETEIPITKPETISPQRKAAQEKRRKQYEAKYPDAKIVNPIDRYVSDEEKVRQLNKLTEENRPVVEKFVDKIKNKFNVFEAKISKKEDDKIIEKSKRPGLIKAKPFYKIEHTDDSFRFGMGIDKAEDMLDIKKEVEKAGFEIYKQDPERMIAPKEWEWRGLNLNLRMPNGQLVECQLTVKELWEAKGEGHKIYDKWRDKTEQEIKDNGQEYLTDQRASRELYGNAWESYLKRSGQSDKDFAASWNNLFASASSTIVKSLASSSAKGGLSKPLNQVPDRLTAASSSPEGVSNIIQASPESVTEPVILSGVSIADKNTKKEDKNQSPIKQKIQDKIKSIEDNELNDLFNDFVSKSKLTSGIDPEQLAAGVKLVTKYAELNVLKFSDIVLDIYSKVGEKTRELFDALKQAYSAYRSTAPDDIYDQLEDVRKLDFDTIISEISSGKENEAQNGNSDEESGPDRSTENERSEEVQDTEIEESVEPVGGPGVEPNTQQLPGDNGQQPTDKQPGSKRTSDAGPSLNQNNHRIKAGTLNTSTFSVKQKYDNNIAAIKKLKELQKKNRKANKKEKEILAQYVGWGGMSQVFQGYGEWSDRQEELEKLLTEKEYNAAKASTPNAHFTSEQIINNVWKVVNKLGYNGGKILEPGMGVGNFFGLIPSNLSSRSELNGIELDDITTQIAKYLYPDAVINQGLDKGVGYQEVFIPSNSINLVVGNVPFANVQVYDEAEPEAYWSKHQQSLHNFFILKSMDKVKPGGLMAIVTSHYTMDGKNPAVRRKLAESADLVAAYKLPNDAFKASSNTEVSADLLIFRKKDPGNPYTGEKHDWINSVEHTVGYDKVNLNEYYVANPKNVFGELSSEGGNWRNRGKEVVEVSVTPSGELDEHFRKAINRLGKDVYTATVDPLTVKKPEVKNIVDDMKRKLPGVMTVKDGKVYVLDKDGEAVEMPGLKGEAKKIEGMDKLRNNLFTLFEEQMKTPDDARIKYLVEKYDKQYDQFVKQFGKINSPQNVNYFNNDPDYGRLRALEIFNDDTKTWEKSGLLKGRVFKAIEKPTEIKNIKEAVAYVQGSTGKLDFDEVARLTGRDKDIVLSEMLDKDLIFEDLNGDYVPSDEYLTGEVVKKLREAEKAAIINPKYEKNVAALKGVQPARVKYSEVETKLGANFVPGKVYTEFLRSLFQTPKLDLKFRWLRVGAESMWVIDDPVGHRTQLNKVTRNETTFGTKDYYGIDIIEKMINNKSLSVTFTDPITKKPVFDQEGTLAAEQKADDIRQEWKKFLDNNVDAQQLVEQGYNEIMNTSVRRKFDGGHLTLEGVANFVDNREYIFRPYQKNAIWRMVQKPFNLLDHPVGSGKTGTLAAGIMERRRLGLTKKAIWVTKKGLVEQSFREVQALYPNARILMPGESDFELKNRPAFLNRVKTNDWDIVILSYQNYTNLKLSPEYESKFVEEQIQEIEEAIGQAYDGSKNNPTVKELEKKKQRLLEKIRKRKAELGKGRKTTANKIDYFDQLGFDYIAVDEAHNYKNLFAPTSRTRVKGIGQTESQRSFDMAMKLWWVHQQENMGVTFATGTPVSNTLTEFFIMQKYLQPERLKEKNVISLDDWLDIFTETQTRLELTAEGKGMRPQTRVSRLVNLPELLKIYSEITDMVTKEEVGKHLEVPKIKGGKPENIEIVASEEQLAYYESLAKRAERLRKEGKKIDPREDNFLKISTEGRKASLDIRLVVPKAADNPNGKMNVASRHIHEIWKETKANKSTQLVFMDLGAPGGTAMIDLYADLKTKLIKRGIPKEEIAFVHDAKNKNQLKALYKRVNEGKVRVLFGSTAKLSEGVNVQKKLYAMHHLDPTYKPSELEQREGRILRFGNENKEVRILRYVTQGVGDVAGFDAYMYQLLENKIRGISQASNPDTTLRSVEEAEGRALTYAEIKAIATGNPLIMEKISLDNDVQRLERQRSSHAQDMYHLEYQKSTLPGKIEEAKTNIKLLEKVLKAAQPAEKKISIIDLETGETQTFAEAEDKEWKKNAGAAIVKSYQYAAEKNIKDPRKLGEYGGLEVMLQVSDVDKFDSAGAKVGTDKSGMLKIMPKDIYAGRLLHVVDKYDFISIVGGINTNNIVDRYAEHISNEMKYIQNELDVNSSNLSKIDQEITPFKNEELLREKLNRLQEVNKLLEVKEAEHEVEKETSAEDEELLEQEDSEEVDTSTTPIYQALRDKTEYKIDEIAGLAGVSEQEVSKAFKDLEAQGLLISIPGVGYAPTSEFKILLNDMFQNPDKYEADYPMLYSNPIPQMLKAMDSAITFVDDIFKKYIGDKIYKGAGIALDKVVPDIIKKQIITNYGLPAEYVSLKKATLQSIARFKDKAIEIGDLLRYSNVEKKISFTREEQVRLQQIIRGSITNNPLLKERGQKAIDEIKALERLGKQLEVLPIETYNTKLPRRRIAELLKEKADYQVKLDEAKAQGSARRQVVFESKISNIDKKIQNSYKLGGQGYFKRVYLSKEQARTFKKYGYARPTRLDLTSAIKRKDIPYEVRKQMGEVLTASYPVAKSIMLEGKDVSFGRFFEAIAENPSYAMTKEEYDAAPKDDFVKLPEDERLGKLSEMYVQKEIAADINDVMKFTDPDNIETFFKQITANWKATKTIMNPSTHLRNIYSNSIMLDFSGVSQMNQARLIPETIKMLYGKGKFADKWKASHLDQTTFNAEELGKYLDVVAADRSFMDLSIPDKILKVYGKVSLVDTKIGETMGKIYQMEELLGKGIKFIAELEKNKTVKEATDEANKWLFDYADVPKLVRTLRTNPFFGVPFITWSYKALPRIIEAAITRPVAFWKYPVIFGAIMRYALQALGLDDDEWKEIQKTLPEKMVKGQWLLLPFRDEAGKMQMLDLTYILPYKDVYDIMESGYTLASSGKFNNGDSITEGVLGLIQAPVFKTAAEIMTNRNTYSNMPLWYEYADSPTEKAIKAFDYLYKSYMPALAPEIPYLTSGGYAWNKLASVVMNRDDYYGRSFSLAPAIGGSLFGIKTSPIEPEKNLERKSFQIQSQIGELGAKRNRILRDGGMSEEERLSAAADIDQQIEDLKKGKQDLNVPEYTKDIRGIAKVIRKLQYKLRKIPTDKRQERAELLREINKYKIQLDKQRSSGKIFEDDETQEAGY